MMPVLLSLALLTNPPVRTAEEAAASALQVGQKAPDFTLKDASGARVRLSDLLKRGPVVLTWYRGGWCPYCNIALKQLQDSLAVIEGAGAMLVAVSPELPDNSLTTSEKHELRFPVLSDEGLTVAERYGIAYTLDEPTATRYNGSFGLNRWNGDTSNRLPLPATFVIGTDGVIRYRFVDVNIRNRASIEAIRDALAR